MGVGESRAEEDGAKRQSRRRNFRKKMVKPHRRKRMPGTDTIDTERVHSLHGIHAGL